MSEKDKKKPFKFKIEDKVKYTKTERVSISQKSQTTKIYVVKKQKHLLNDLNNYYFIGPEECKTGIYDFLVKEEDLKKYIRPVKIKKKSIFIINR